MKTMIAICIPMAAVLLSRASVAETNSVTEKRWTATQAEEYASSETEGHALGSMIVLTSLRNGKTEVALETLECELDAAVVAAWHLWQTGTEQQKLKQMQFLRTIKDYRTKHPRKQEAKLADGALLKTLEKLTADAEKILMDLK